MDLSRRDIVLKIIAAAGMSPLLLSGCSWWSSDNKTSSSGENSLSGSVLADDVFFCFNKNKNNYEILSVSSDGVKTVSTLPQGFVPGDIAWGESAGLVTAKEESIVIAIDRQGRLKKEIISEPFIMSGHMDYWSEQKLFVLAGQDPYKKIPSLCFYKDNKELDFSHSFDLEKCKNSKAIKVVGEKILISEHSEDPEKEPSRILSYSLTDKAFVNYQMVNKPFLPGVIAHHSDHVYVGLLVKNKEGAYLGAPVLHMNLKTSRQEFMVSKSNRVRLGMRETFGYEFSSDKKVIAFIHREGSQVTFWNTEDQSFAGMLSLKNSPEAIVSTLRENQFILFLKETQPLQVDLGFEEIKATAFGRHPIKSPSIAIKSK